MPSLSPPNVLLLDLLERILHGSESHPLLYSRCMQPLFCVCFRHTKHKAFLAGSIEVDVPTDGVDFDGQLERAVLERDARGGSLNLSQRQAAYRAFSSCE